jgi:hypothetical protein
MKRVSPLSFTVRRAMSWRSSHSASASSAAPNRCASKCHAESQSRQYGDEDAPRRRRGRQEARQLEPFAGDGQHQEAGPPRHHFVHGKAAQPEQVAGEPAGRAGGQREGEQGALAQEHRD